MWCTRFNLLTTKYSGTVNISISGMWLLSWPLHSPRIFRCFGELLSVDSIWFPREVYSKSLVGPLAPGSLESAESYLYFAIDKWWQNTVLYSDTPLQQVLNENVVKIKINTSKRPNSKLSEIQIDLMRLSLFLGRIQEEQSEQTSLGFYAVCLLKPYCLLVNMVSVV